MFSRFALFVASLALPVSAWAGGVPSQMTVGVAPPPPPPVYQPPVYPYPYGYVPVLPREKPRCEQDRLLTADDPCETNPLVRRSRGQSPD